MLGAIGYFAHTVSAPSLSLPVDFNASATNFDALGDELLSYFELLLKNTPFWPLKLRSDKPVQLKGVKLAIPILLPMEGLSLELQIPMSHHHKQRKMSFDLDTSHIFHSPDLVSIIYLTARPGSYDMLFNSLYMQTDHSYELIIIDELVDHRKEAILRRSKELQLPVVAVVSGT